MTAIEPPVTLRALVDEPRCPECARAGEDRQMHVNVDWDELLMTFDCGWCGWVERGEGL